METELSVDDIFNFLVMSKTTKKRNVMRKHAERHVQSEKMVQSASSLVHHPFEFCDRNSFIAIEYRKLPLPWYVSSR